MHCWQDEHDEAERQRALKAKAIKKMQKVSIPVRTHPK